MKALASGAIEVTSKPTAAYSVGDIGIQLADKIQAAAHVDLKHRVNPTQPHAAPTQSNIALSQTTNKAMETRAPMENRASSAKGSTLHCFTSDQVLTSIHRAAPIAIGMVINQKFVSVNAHMCKMLGYREDELLGKSPCIVYATQAEFEMVSKEKHALLETESIGTVETQWLSKCGRLIDILLSSTVTDRSDKTNCVTFTATDISKQKALQRENAKIISSLGSVIADRTQWLNENNSKLQSEIDKRACIEKELRASKEELQNTIKQLQHTKAQSIQSEKMASIGKLAAGVAHEINNPTAFVSSNLHTMAEYQVEMTDLLLRFEKVTTLITQTRHLQELPEAVSHAILEAQQFASEIDLTFIRNDFSELIKESCDGTVRIQKIVADLKDFAHPGLKERQETDINQGMDSTINIVWNEIKYNSVLSKEYGDIPTVWCYSQQINQVFMNLLINAAQAIKENGKIQVRTRAKNGHVIVQVSDNGGGIPQEILPQIFDPFFTTKEVGKGTGLGLSVAYSIIQEHNGKIEVESKLGAGSTFTIYLPTTQQALPEG